MTTLLRPPPHLHVAWRDDPARRERRRLWRRWTGVVTLGESVGFLAPVAAGVASESQRATTGAAAVLLAGAVEGAVLGWAQHRVLRQVLPGIRAARWVALTAGAAVVAYLLGFLLAYLGGIGSALAIAAMVVVGALLLATIGAAQQVELRHHVPDSGRWVRWTVLAWLLGLATFFAVAPPLWHAGQPAGVAIAIGAVAGVAMAFVQAAVTGVGLLRLLAAPGRHLGAGGRP